MSKELNRMQKLAGVPVKKETESLNEHQIGGIVGVGAINQILPREKTDYEMAFEHYMNEEMDPITGTDIDDIEISSPPDFGDDEITGTELEEIYDLSQEKIDAMKRSMEDALKAGKEGIKDFLKTFKSK